MNFTNKQLRLLKMACTAGMGGPQVEYGDAEQRTAFAGLVVRFQSLLRKREEQAKTHAEREVARNKKAAERKARKKARRTP